MGGGNGLSFGRERPVSGEEFRISGSSPALDTNQGGKELAQPFRRWTRPCNERAERRHHLVDPTLNDQIPKFRLGPYVAVNGSVAHAKRARYIDHSGFFWAEPSQHILGGGYNSIATEGLFRQGVIPTSPLTTSLASSNSRNR